MMAAPHGRESAFMSTHSTCPTADGLRRVVRMAAAMVAVVVLSANARAEDPVSKVVFACKDDKTIDATFYADRVDLTLSDGRSMSLPQTMSGSGIRYANAEETFVFWSKGDTAFVTEGADATETYSDCVTK
jgi:membrane-bound inhibitor of C-type lysozyme